MTTHAILETVPAPDWGVLVHPSIDAAAASLSAGVPVVGDIIGGAYVGTDDWIDVVAPAKRDLVVAKVARSDAASVDRAVAAAAAAFPTWASLHFGARAKALLDIADAIEDSAEEISRIVALETGNALRTQARTEAGFLVGMLRYFAGAAAEVKGTVLPAGANQLQYSRRQPLGVVGAIVPWNSPLMIAAYKIPAALAAGNTIVLKAAEEAPLGVLRVGEICQSVLPPGVVNVIAGYGIESGAALARHRGVAKVSFTGSTAVGRTIATTAAERLVRSSLELGGKSPTVVFPQPVTDALADEVILAMRMTRQGQSCTAGSRLLVHADIHDELLARIAQQLSKLVIGDPLDEASDIGSLINERQATRVRDFVAEAQGLPGADIVCGGPEPVGSPDGLYFEPTVISGVQPDWRIVQEEVFGPVLVAVPWIDVEQAVELANATHYGLAAFVFAPRIDDALGVAHRIDAGWVQVNQGGGQGPGQSFGGFKDSGIGREASLEGMLEGFTQIKQINVRLG